MGAAVLSIQLLRLVLGSLSVSGEGAPVRQPRLSVRADSADLRLWRGRHSADRALDLRALLESMERYAKELQALHGGLDSINERVSGMIRDFAAHVDSRQEELAASARRVTAARDRVREMMDQKRLSLEDGAKERFANLERVLNEAASYLPDVSALRAEVEAARAKYDRQSEELRRIRERRLLRAEHALRNNPTAASRRHRGPFEQLKRIQRRDEEEKKA